MSELESNPRVGTAADGSTADLWQYYNEQAAQARQHESLRASVTSTLSGVAAAVIGLAGIGGFERTDVLAGAVVVLVGALGSALSIKHYERNRFHTEVLKEVRDAIDTMRDARIQPMSTGDLRTRAKQHHADNFALFKSGGRSSETTVDRRPASESKPSSRWVSVPLHFLWLGLPAAISVAGILVIALALMAPE